MIMGSPYAGMFNMNFTGDQEDSNALENYVSLTAEQKRKKQEEENFRNLPWYMRYDQEAKEGLLGTEELPTALGRGVSGVEGIFEGINKGRDIATSAIAGVPTQPYRETLEGAFTPEDIRSGMSPTSREVSFDSLENETPPSTEDLLVPETVSKPVSELLYKGIESASDPSNLIPMGMMGPLGALATAPLFGPKMISSGAEQIGQGSSEALRENDPAEGNRLIAGGIVDLGMGSLMVKHPIESLGSVVAKGVPSLQRPIKLNRPGFEENIHHGGLAPDLENLSETPSSRGQFGRGYYTTNNKNYAAEYASGNLSGLSGGKGKLNGKVISFNPKDLDSLDPLYVSDLLPSKNPSSQRGAIGPDISKVNSFEDSQYRKYGPEWKRLQPLEEKTYHENLTKGTLPPIDPVQRALAGIDDPAMVDRVNELIDEGYPIDRASRIAKAEKSEIPEEFLTMEDMQAVMEKDRDKSLPEEVAPIDETGIGEPIEDAGINVEPLIGDPNNPMMAEPMGRGGNGRKPPSFKSNAEPLEIFDTNEEGGLDISRQEIDLIDRISKAQDIESISSLKDEARNLGSVIAYDRALRRQQMAEKRKTQREGKQAERAVDKQEQQELRSLVQAGRLTERIDRAQASEIIKQTPPPVDLNAITDKDNFRQTFAKLTPWQRTNETLGIFKSLRASGDLGQILRQGKMLTLDMLFNDPKNLKESLNSMKKQTFSEAEFKATQEMFENDPITKKYQEDFGLDIPGVGKNLKEEAFHGSLAEKIPVIGKNWIRPSDRAYTSYLNAARVWKMNNIVDKFKEVGLSPDNPADADAFRSAAKVVNILSARGDFKQFGSTLNTVSNWMWSPRNRASKFQLLHEYVKAKTGAGEQLHPIAAKELTRGLERVTALNAGLLALAAGTGAATVETDPRSTDFARFRFGNTVIDPWFGLQPIIRGIARGTTGTTINAAGKEGRTNFGTELGRYLVSGAAPGVTLIKEQVTGSDLAGYQKDRLKSLADSVTPMIAENIREQLTTNGFGAAAATAPLEFLGESVDLRPPKPFGSTSPKAPTSGWRPSKGKKKKKTAW